MATVSAIEDLLRRGVPVTLLAVGGRAAVEPDVDELVRSPYLDVLVGWADDAHPGEEAFTDDLLVKGFENAAFAVSLRAAAAALVAASTLRTRIGPRLTKSLEARASSREDDRAGLIAVYALAIWLRLALGNVVQRHRLISVLVEIQPDENSLFVEHAAKIVGAAFHAWRESDLLPVLERLRRNPDARGEAAFEYGHALLAVALDGEDAQEVMGGLETAKALFGEAVSVDPDRSDAQVYAAVIDVVRSFARGAVEADLASAWKALESAAADRTFLLSAGQLPDWLAPRRDRDVQWHELLGRVPRLAADLGRPSWLRACEVLDHLLKVYDADRTVADGVGFGVLIRPRVEASFVRERGLLAHLDDRLRDDDFIGDHREAAVALRQRIYAISIEPSRPGKAGEGALLEELRGALDGHGAASPFTERVLGVIGDKLVLDGEIANPVVQRVFADIQARLEGGTDYGDEVRISFERLVLQVILFCLDRQDAGKKELGARGDYLFSENPVEADLQKDLREFLVGNLLGAAVQTELEGIAKGRCDVYVGHGGWRFLIELKRHEASVTPLIARSYVGQAASYQGTNVKLGMLGILEIVDRKGPAPGLEDCVWFDTVVPEKGATVRHLVVFRVPARLRRPNELSR
ncbi:MAG: hypothetical protein J0I67_07220 [Bosea sp.]|nr:hypothetical protein [Bosea sp. (in: a-proteobacteria)]